MYPKDKQINSRLCICQKKKKEFSLLLNYTSALKIHSNTKLVAFQFIGFEMETGKVTQAHDRIPTPETNKKDAVTYLG